MYANNGREHYFNNQSLPHDAQIYRKKLAVLFAVSKTIFYRIRLRSLIALIRSLTNNFVCCRYQHSLQLPLLKSSLKSRDVTLTARGALMG